MKRKILAVLTAALLALNLLGVGYTAADGEPVTLRVVTWNICHGSGRLLKQREQLREMDADICFLQEVDEGTDRINGYSCLRTLGMSLYSYRYLGDYREYEGGKFGSGILSKKKLTGFTENTADGTVDTGHVRGVWKKDGLPVSVYNVHLDYQDDDLRAAQIEALAADFFADENPCRIIAGDFNLKDFSELAPFAEMGIVSNDDTYFPTYQGLDWDTQAIDNIIYTPGTLRLTEAEMFITENSDHNALAASFEVIVPAEE